MRDEAHVALILLGLCLGLLGCAMWMIMASDRVEDHEARLVALETLEGAVTPFEGGEARPAAPSFTDPEGGDAHAAGRPEHRSEPSQGDMTEGAAGTSSLIREREESPSRGDATPTAAPSSTPRGYHAHLAASPALLEHAHGKQTCKMVLGEQGVWEEAFAFWWDGERMAPVVKPRED